MVLLLGTHRIQPSFTWDGRKKAEFPHRGHVVSDVRVISVAPFSVLFPFVVLAGDPMEPRSFKLPVPFLALL